MPETIKLILLFMPLPGIVWCILKMMDGYRWRHETDAMYHDDIARKDVRRVQRERYGNL